MKKLTMKGWTRQTSLLSVLTMLVMCIASMFSTGCSDERQAMAAVTTDSADFIRDHYYETERTLFISPLVYNQQARSDANVTQNATMFYERENLVMNPKPELTLYAVLSKPRIEIATVDSLPVRVIRSYIQSLTPYRNGLKFGQDGIKIWELSDGQVITAHWSMRYDGVVVGRDTLATPHAEITDLIYNGANFEKYGTQTVTEDPYKMEVELIATLTPKGISGQQVSSQVSLKPWYEKVVTSKPTTVISVSYDGSHYVGCPVNSYQVIETVVTNKDTLVNTAEVPVWAKFNAPTVREQPSLDSLFSRTSTGKFAEEKLSEVKNEDGFTIRTMSGTHTSSNVGTKNRTNVESVVSFTYQIPVKYESEYGTFNIPAIALSFEEIGFSIKRISETAESKSYESVNTLLPKFGDCVMDALDEKVNLVVAVTKKDVVAVDSTYVLSGDGDEYVVDKEVTMSDGNKKRFKYSYTAYHRATAQDFGEMITNTVSNWSAGTLQSGSQTKKAEEKKFSDVTKFVITYVTTPWQSRGSNGSQNVTFAFTETVPEVVFHDGAVKKTFDKRSYVMTGKGATLASNYTIVVRNAVSYKSYDYEYQVDAAFNGGTAENLVSKGLLLVAADEAGEAKYTFSGPTWSGNEGTVKVTKTIPHTYADDEVKVWTESLTVGLTDLTDARLDADDTNFNVKETHTENTTPQTSNPWKKNLRTRPFNYVVTNGIVSRDDLNTTVTDGTIEFDDGSFKHTFDLRLNVSHNASLGTTTREGNYNVTPHRLTVTAVNGSKSLSTTGITNIYVKRNAEITSHTEKTKVYDDGTVDAEITFAKDDGTTETIKASDAFGHRFQFNFTNTPAQEKVVTKLGHTGSIAIGSATPSTHSQGKWKVTEQRYAPVYALDNGVGADKLTATYGFSNYEFVYTDGTVGTIKVPMPNVNMTAKSLNINATGVAGGYQNHSATVVVGATALGTEGSYGRDLSVTHTLKIKVDEEPPTPHFGKPKSFMVTATYDPTSQVTQRAFCFQWENGVTYAVCPYETMLPNTSDFMYKKDNYQGYNSVAYDNNATNHWVPARGSDDADAIRWYDSSNHLISAIDKALSCMVIGWKNIVNGGYAMEIQGYTYVIDGYTITVTAPNGQRVDFNSHYE